MLTEKLALTALTLCLLALAGCGKKSADLVLKNGTIYTVDANFSTVTAVAVQGNRIVATGDEAAISVWIGPQTQVIDLQGATVVPGLADAHYHFLGVGKRAYYLNLDGSSSLEDFLQKVAAEVEGKQPGEWVIGRGWIEEDWPSKRFPTRHDLDRVAPRNPVFLTRADGHAAVVNSAALRTAGITSRTADPQGGEILRDEKGQPTGMLIDRAMSFLRSHLPPDTTADMTRAYALKAQKQAFAYGLTQVHDMGISRKRIEQLKPLFASGDLKIRLHEYVRGPGADADSLLSSGPETGLFDHRLTVRGIKISQDGALGSRGAALLAPYSDAETQGLLMHEHAAIYPAVTRALQTGVQLAIHAIGDRANRDILDLYARAFAEIPPEERRIAEPRFRIEHAQIVAPEDIPRFKELGVIPSMQPSHAIGDLHFAIRRLGRERLAGAYAWNSFVKQGSIVPAGSDAPVEEGNPMIEFYAAVVRKDTTGFATPDWHAEQRLSREDALRALTIWPAQAVFEEHLRGSIEPGKLADFTIFEKNLMTEPEERLFDIPVKMTIVAGEVVFEKK